MEYKGYRVPQDLGLLAGLFFLLVYYSLFLQFLPVPRLIESARRNLRQESLREADSSDKENLDKIWRGCGFILDRLFRTSKPCLRRTLVLHRWCCKQNIASTVVVGFLKNGRELKGHSWLLVNGEPFGERPADLERYIQVLGE